MAVRNVAPTFDTLRDALDGDEASARAYARAWRARVREIVEAHPDAPAATSDVLDHIAITAPFDAGGPEHALMSAAASIIDDMPPAPSVASSIELPAPLDYQRFTRVVLAELSGAGTGIERLLAAWQLSVTDVAGLFGVRRQAVQQWLADGVPPARQPKLLVLMRVADLLERNLLPDRIPGIVRTPARAYGGRSMLQMIAQDRHDDLLHKVARSFDWAATA